MSPGAHTILHMALRVVLADDEYLVREGATALLASVPEVEVAQAVDGLDALLGAVDRHDPDVVLTDIRMPPGPGDEGIEAARVIRERHPSIGVVVLSSHLDGEYAWRLLRDGAAGRGYLLKERISELEILVRALRDVARGGTVLDPAVVERLLRRSEAPPIAALTPREREVLELMARGASDGGIMAELGLSDRTVDKHSNAVFRKLGLLEQHDVNRRVVAVLEYLRSTQPASR